MRKVLLVFFALMVLTSFVFAGGSSEKDGKSDEKIILKFGHVLQPTHPYHKMALKFKEEIEKMDSRVEVQIFPARQLGNARELAEGLQLGSIDVTTITSAVCANFVPEFNVMSLPFLFDDADHLFKVMDSDIGDNLADKLEENGFIKLGYAYGGVRDMYSSVPIKNLDDLKGKKIRTMENEVLIDTWNSLGAIATPIPWGDVYLSLKQNVVDGGEGTGVSFNSMKFYDSCLNYAKISYVFSWHNFMISKITWDKMDKDLQEKVLKAGKIAQDYERELFLEDEKVLFDKLSNEHNVEIVVPADIAKWKETAYKVYEKKAADFGGMDFINLVKNK